MNAFLARMAPDLAGMAFLSYLGGEEDDWGSAVGVRSGRPYLVGGTVSEDFPATTVLGEVQVGACGQAGRTCLDPFVARFAADGTDVLYLTRVAEPYHRAATALAVSQDGRALIAGWHADAPGGGGMQGAYVLGLDPLGTEATFELPIDGEETDLGLDIALDAFGRAFTIGATWSAGLAMEGALDDVLDGPFDGHLGVVDATGSPSYLSYVGGVFGDEATGVAVDEEGCVHVLLATTSPGLPTLNPLPDGDERHGMSDMWLSVTCWPPPEAPSRRFEKEVSPDGLVAVGEEIVYSLTIENEGPLHDVVVTDVLPTGVDFVSASPPSCTTDPGLTTVTCDLGDVAPGAQTLEIRVQATELGYQCNAATLVSAEGVAEATACHFGAGSVVVVPVPELSIKKGTSQSAVAEGSLFEYEIAVTNVGDATASEGTMTDDFPDGLDFVNAEPDDCAYHSADTRIECTIGTLEPNAFRNFTITARATRAGVLCNSAEATAAPAFPIPGPMTIVSEPSCVTAVTSPDLSVIETIGSELGTVGKCDPCTASEQCVEGLVCARRRVYQEDCFLIIFCDVTTVTTAEALCEDPGDEEGCLPGELVAVD